MDDTVATGIPLVRENDDRESAAAGPGERVNSIDVLRGVAVLGMLGGNIVLFSWPVQINFDPNLLPGVTPWDVAFFVIKQILFDTKNGTIFAMLFGAGLVLMDIRARSRGIALAPLYLKRMFWLLLIGLVHAYFIWEGDVLTAYAFCGVLLMRLRRFSPRTLLAVTVSVMAFSGLFLYGMGVVMRALKPTMERFAARLGDSTSAFDVEFRKATRELEELDRRPTPAEIRQQITTYRSTYRAIIKHRAPILLEAQTIGFPTGIFSIVAPRVILGMALMKWSVFSARRSRRFYLVMLVGGYGVGLCLLGLELRQTFSGGFSILETSFGALYLLKMYGGIAIALGHVAVVMLICRAGIFFEARRRLAAVGRMALSVYLADSIVCTTLFYGYGAGLFGAVHFPGLAAIVASLWAVQLAVCPYWMDRYQFGPAEWLWRSLAYGKPQPLRRVACVPA